MKRKNKYNNFYKNQKRSRRKVARKIVPEPIIVPNTLFYEFGSMQLNDFSNRTLAI